MSATLQRLGEVGAVYRDPVAGLDWSAADPAKPWLPPSLLNLAALGDVAGDPDLVLRFSRLEFARLCAAGLWLEGILIGQITRHGVIAAHTDEARVTLNEVREEAGHGLMFLDAINRAGFSGVDLLGPTRLLTWVARRLDPAHAPFWAMTYIGEAATDVFATKALKHREVVCPAAHRVLWLHHRDEARHIAAARAFIEEKLAVTSRMGRQAFPFLMHALLRIFLDATFYPTPASLRALGLADPDAAARRARCCPQRRALVESCLAPALDGLAQVGLIPAAA